MFNRLFVSLVLVVGLAGLVAGCGDDSSASGYTCRTVCDHKLTECEPDDQADPPGATEPEGADQAVHDLGNCVTDCESAEATMSPEAFKWLVCALSHVCGFFDCGSDADTGEVDTECQERLQAVEATAVAACGPIPVGVKAGDADSR